MGNSFLVKRCGCEPQQIRGDEVSANDPNDSGAGQLRQVPLAPAGEVTLAMEELPRSQDEMKVIHPRRPLPRVPEPPPDEAP
jgi:hypothetical protein